MPVYPPTLWQNNQVPAMNATNLNKLTDELKSQAAAMNIAHTLPTWVNGSGAAISDNVPLNELERVTYQVSLALGITPFSGTQWFDGWNPARNATRLNLLEQGAANNRTAIDALPPPAGTLYDQLSDFYMTVWGGTYVISRYSRTAVENGYQLLSPPGNAWNQPGQGLQGYGVDEVTTPYGPGFHFTVIQAMYHGSQSEDAKSCLVPDENHIWPDSNALNAPFIGVTTDVSFRFMLPTVGNITGTGCNGFSDYTGWNCLYEYHPGGSYPVNNQLGVDPTTNTVYVRVHDGNNVDAPTPAANYGRRPLVLDHWYDYRRVDTWSRTNGTTQAWIDGVQVLNQTGVGNVQANAHGSGNYATVQPNFGYYTGQALAHQHNEVYYGNMRFTVT